MKINRTEIENLEPIKTFAISHIGNYADLCGPFEKLGIWAVENKLWTPTSKMMGVYHDDPSNTPVEKLRSEACLEDISGIEPGKGIKQYIISGGKYFVMQVEISMSECWDAWKKAYDIFNEKGYEYDQRDHYDIFLSCTGDMEDINAPWVVNLCIPAK